MKPRIRIWAGAWCCYDESSDDLGWGQTPTEAYANWFGLRHNNPSQLTMR